MAHTHQRGYFEAVAKVYWRIVNSYPIVAMNPDEDAESKSYPLSFLATDYKVDIESATEKALRGKPDLQAAWFKIVAGNRSVPTSLATQVIEACAPIYEQRGLEPWAYFRRSTLRTT